WPEGGVQKKRSPPDPSPPFPERLCRSQQSKPRVPRFASGMPSLPPERRDPRSAARDATHGEESRLPTAERPDRQVVQVDDRSLLEACLGCSLYRRRSRSSRRLSGLAFVAMRTEAGTHSCRLPHKTQPLEA